MEIELEAITADHLALFAYNNAQGSQTIDNPSPQRIVIDGTSVAVTGLIADEAVSFATIGSLGFTQFTQVLVAPAAAGEVQVVEDGLVFHADDVTTPNKIGQLRRFESFTDVMIGGVNALKSFSDVQLYLQYELANGQKRAFFAPKCTSPDGASFSFQAAGDTITRAFTLLIDTERGFQAPYVDFPISA